jgi:hypothetical protein
MIDTLFDTDEKRETAVLYFRALLQDPGWQLLVKIEQKNIEVLKEQLENDTEGETLEEIKFKRKLLKAHQTHINMPQKMIDDFTGVPTGEEPIIDPYDTKETLIKKRSAT